MPKTAEPQETKDVASFRRMIQEKSGGTHSYVRLLGLDTMETAELLERVEAGFPFRVFERFRKNLHLEAEELAELAQITMRTLARRRKSRHLRAEESDRLLRVSRVLGKVLTLFEGDLEAARAWFSTPALALGNRTPEDVATSELGAREVENLVDRLEHGVVC